MHGQQSFPFEFENVDTSMDSYRGSSARLRYILRVVVSKGVGGFSQDFPVWVQNPSKSPPVDEPIKVSFRDACCAASASISPLGTVLHSMILCVAASLHA